MLSSLLNPRPTSFRHVYAVSDVHTDYKQNLEWATSLCGHDDDVLLVAGDVSDDPTTFEATMAAFASSFGAVFFVPGNHDCWTRRDSGLDSFEKLKQIRQICGEHGVLTTPQTLTMRCGGAVSVLPLLSWYHTSFDTEPDVTQIKLPPAKAVVGDYRATRWPEPLRNGDESLAQFFDEMCDELPGERAKEEAAGREGVTPLLSYSDARANGASVISFSHFVPSIELIPEKRYLTYPPLMSAVGSRFLEKRVEELAPDVHVFGHTHFGWDATIQRNGRSTRYIQAALATPAERSRRPRSLTVSYDLDIDQTTTPPKHIEPPKDALGDALPLEIWRAGANGNSGFCPPRRAAWSDHYNSRAREPSDVTPAPWVVDYYSRRAPQRLQLDPNPDESEKTEREKWALLKRMRGWYGGPTPSKLKQHSKMSMRMKDNNSTK